MFNGQEKIRELLAEVCAIDPGAVSVDRPLIEYGLDSARAIDLLVALEGEFGIDIPDAAASRMKNFGDIVDYVQARVAEKQA